jgi:hypothetical protein
LTTVVTLHECKTIWKLLNNYRLIYNAQVMRDFINLFIYFTLIALDTLFIYLFTTDYFYDALLVYELKYMWREVEVSPDLISFIFQIFDWSDAEKQQTVLVGLLKV